MFSRIEAPVQFICPLPDLYDLPCHPGSHFPHTSAIILVPRYSKSRDQITTFTIKQQEIGGKIRESITALLEITKHFLINLNFRLIL